MKNIIKVAFLSSIITAAMVYVVLEWRPLRSETARAPEVSWASSVASSPAAVPAARLSDEERNNIEVYQKYSQGVVNITTTTVGYDFFLRPVPMESGTGSGAIIDTQGHIVTNFHVIREAERLEVTLPDKTKHIAKVVGSDPNNDLAVIQIDLPRAGLIPIPVGTSKGLQVGQKVLAIGNPYGLERSLTTGIISSLGRSIQAENGRVIEDIIQTDAAINPGNSGGPLLNSEGQIIGINTAIVSGGVGLGFAIPADTVRRITSDLVTLGYVRRPYLGVSQRGLIALMDVPWLADGLRLSTEVGLLVVTVQPNSPAALAGIHGASQEVIVRNYRVPAGGDVILAFQGKEVNSLQDLAREIDRYKPGDKVAVTILRGNKKTDLPVVLQEAPKQ
ncbi:MAG: peptidase [Acidobacteria bacterium]|nr:MAG: peptidase [Acidobacteriota bacterium]